MLEKEYHVILPALPGYDGENPREDFTSKAFHFISYRTIWRTFESCNNYKMPEGIIEYPGKLEYWYGEKERKERTKDLNYVRRHFSRVGVVEMAHMGHASMAPLYPEKLAERIKTLVQKGV